MICVEAPPKARTTFLTGPSRYPCEEATLSLTKQTPHLLTQYSVSTDFFDWQVVGWLQNGVLLTRRAAAT